MVVEDGVQGLVDDDGSLQSHGFSSPRDVVVRVSLTLVWAHRAVQSRVGTRIHSLCAQTTPWARANSVRLFTVVPANGASAHPTRWAGPVVQQLCRWSQPAGW